MAVALLIEHSQFVDLFNLQFSFIRDNFKVGTTVGLFKCSDYQPYCFGTALKKEIEF